MGFAGKFLHVESYLENRRQATFCDGIHSDIDLVIKPLAGQAFLLMIHFCILVEQVRKS